MVSAFTILTVYVAHERLQPFPLVAPSLHFVSHCCFESGSWSREANTIAV
jgi:hypothetical protein